VRGVFTETLSGSALYKKAVNAPLKFFNFGGVMKIKTRIFIFKIGFLEFMEAWCVKKARKVRKKYYKWSIRVSGGER